MIGGLIEFGSNLALAVSFYYSGLAKINQGISGAMISCNAIMVVIFSAIIYKERVTIFQMIGILMIVSGVATVAILKAHLPG